MTRRDVDGQVARLARKQHGAFSLAQVLAIGGSHALARRRLQAGAWLRLDRAVYCLPGNPPTYLRQLKAAELGHPAAVISGAAAAVLHGLSDARAGRPEVTIPRGAKHRSSIAAVRRRDGVHVTRIEQIMVTDLAQTLIDASSRVDHGTLQRWASEALLRKAIGADDLARRSLGASARAVQGAGRLRRVLDDLLGGDRIPESELEQRLREAIRRAAIGPVIYQATPSWWPASSRVDAMLPDHRVIIEADGRAWHTRVGDFERDRERDNLAALHGFRVLRLTWRMLTTNRMQAIEQLRRIAEPQTLSLPNAPSSATSGALAIGKRS